MWMKDTLIALDMIFIDERGAVVNVAENTVPLSSATISSNGPVLAVLEVNAGTAARLGIRPGTGSCIRCSALGSPRSRRIEAAASLTGDGSRQGFGVR